MSDATDPTTAIGLPPRADEEEQGPPGSTDLWKGRGINLLGLVSPASNLAMVWMSPKEIRWVGVGAGVISAAGIWWAQAQEWPNVAWGFAILHYSLVVLGLIHPLWPEFPARAWVAFGKLLGMVMSFPIFALVFYGAVTPTAVLARLFGRDPLQRKAPPGESYWVEHEPPAKERYERQF